LIEVLPLVWQIDIVCVLWQVGRASAAGALIIDTTVTPAMSSADLLRTVICPPPFGLPSRTAFRPKYWPRRS
jgi:hypothetical protein